MEILTKDTCALIIPCLYIYIPLNSSFFRTQEQSTTLDNVPKIATNQKTNKVATENKLKKSKPTIKAKFEAYSLERRLTEVEQKEP